MALYRNRTLLALAFFQVCAGLIEVESILFGAFMSSLGATPDTLGFVLGAGYAVGVLGSILGGRLVDIVGARIVFLGSIALSIVGLVVEAFSPTWIVAAVGFFMIQFSQMSLRPSALRIVAEAFPDSMGAALGFLYMAYSGVAVAGPLLAGWLAQHYGWNVVFMGKAGLYLLAFFVLAMFIPTGSKLVSLKQEEKHEGWVFVFRRMPLVMLYVAAFIGAFFSYASSFLSYDPRLSASSLALAVFPSIFNLSQLVSSWPSGVLGDKAGYWKIVLGGAVLMGCAWLLFPIPSETVFLYILYLVFSIGSIMSNYIEVLAVKLSPTTGQGLAVGFLDAARFMGFSLGEIFGGMLWQYAGASVSYLLAGLGYILAYVFLLLSYRSSKGS
jgi:DHA1 family multidrug resistance protein-like MFS transporter